jgi:hypothetical protein
LIFCSDGIASGFLDMKESFMGHRITDSMVLVLRKKFHVTDSLVNHRENPSMLHFVYLDAKHSVIKGVLPVDFDSAVQLAALQLQAEFGNYDPLQHVAGFFT